MAQFDGKVRWLRQYRATSECIMNIRFFPFDEQQCPLIFASRDDPSHFMELSLERWNIQNNLNPWLKSVEYEDTNVNVFQHQYWSANNEWTLMAYKYKEENVESTQGTTESTVKVTIRLRRSHNYYEVTLFCPVILLSVLSVVGIILPIDSGEKKGY